MRIAILSTHLSGTGHFMRSLALARAGRAAGDETLLINGGRPLDHIDCGDTDLAQIPPLSIADLDFKTLRRADGTPADDAYLQRRSEAIRDALTRFAPDVLVTETFPLGRRMLAAEFEAALDATPALAIASVRDLPEPKPKRLAEAEARLSRRYAGVLVHGDEGFIPLSATWPLAPDLASRVHHTGYLRTQPRAERATPGDTILVSVGGGALGRDLLGTAARAARGAHHRWHLLTGGADAAETARAIASAHPAPNLTVEPVRRDYPSLLANAACSVSLCGYNTAVDLAGTTTPAVLIPLASGGEQEQMLRARRLARFDGIALLSADQLTPDRLRQTAENLARSPRRAPPALSIDDGQRAVTALHRIAATRR